MKKLGLVCRESFRSYLESLDAEPRFPEETGSLFPYNNAIAEGVADLLANNLIVGRYLMGQLLIEVYYPVPISPIDSIHHFPVLWKEIRFQFT